MMPYAAFRLSPLFRKISFFLNRRAAWLLHFLDKRYTMLSIVVIGTAGTLFYFLCQSLLRYNYFDWWRWKERALWSSIKLWVLLFLIKGGLQILK